MVDEFLGSNAGLVLAEIELRSVAEPVPLPPWVGPEITGDERFANSSLYQRPYGSWPPASRGD